MIDYIYTSIPYKYLDQLLDDKRLKFFDPNYSVTNDGELINVRPFEKSRNVLYRSILGELTIDVYSKNTIILWGSLHKYYTSGENYSLFSMDAAAEALLRLQDYLNISLKEIEVRSIEIGVNLTGLPIKSDLILKSLIGHKIRRSGKVVPFEKIYTPSEGNFKIAERSEYKIKVYDKALHYKLPYEVFRYELKISTSRKAKSLVAIDTLHSLLDTRKVEKKIIDVLIQKWMEIIIVDYSINHLNQKFKYGNYSYWNSLISDKILFETKLKELEKMSKNSGQNLREKIIDKISALSG